MIANRRRGEVAAELDGRNYRLCLTLGALAELESAFGAGDLNALIDRFRDGRFSATDMIRIIGAGLRGAGNAVSDEEVARMGSPDGAVGLAALAADLLSATFAPQGGKAETPTLDASPGPL